MTVGTAMLSRTNVDAERIWDLGYELLELHLSDTFCDTWCIRRRSNGMMFSWKQIRAEWEDHPQARQAMENEVAVARAVRSRHLPRFLDVHIEHSPYYLLAEWFPGEKLETWLNECGRLNTRLSLWIARQCAELLWDLQQAGMILRDLQSSNILLSPDGTIQLASISSICRSPVNNGSYPQSEESGESAPIPDQTAFSSKPAGLARDWHSLGLVLYQCLTGRSAFELIPPSTLIEPNPDMSALDVRRFDPKIESSVAEFVTLLLSTTTRLSPQAIVDRLTDLELMEILR